MPVPTRARRRRTTPEPLPEAIAGPAEDDGDDAEAGPRRRCVVTRSVGERETMLRFVVGPERQLVPDLRAKLPGRGIWLSATRDVLETARAKNAFSRAARTPVSVPADLVSLVEAGLTRRVTELMGLARRAGQVTYGFERAREWLASHRAGLVIQAKDGSPDERARFLSGQRGVPVAAPLAASALGAVFGRDHVVHVVVAHGRLAEALRIETNRLAGVAGERGKVEQAE